MLAAWGLFYGKPVNNPHQLSRDLDGASVPFLFASFKVSIAISLVGAIVGELPAGARAGLGARLLTGSYYGQTVQIWSALLVASLLAGMLVFLMTFLESSVRKRMGREI